MTPYQARQALARYGSHATAAVALGVTQAALRAALATPRPAPTYVTGTVVESWLPYARRWRAALVVVTVAGCSCPSATPPPSDCPPPGMAERLHEADGEGRCR